MKTANLTGALLDYWVARAEGIPAEQLSIRPVPRTDDIICVREWNRRDDMIGCDTVRLDYSTNWARGGPLIEKYKLELRIQAGFYYATPIRALDEAEGYTPLLAICRAVVRTVFGGEVEDVPCA